MSNSSTAYFDSDAAEGFAPYRAISKAAVASVVIGVVSLLPAIVWFMGTVAPALLLLPLTGALLGLIGWRNIRRYPTELTGTIPALLGIALGGLWFVTGAATQSIVYATEVPDGYERVAFEVLKARSQQPDLPPDDALLLDGRRVFIKGYIYPGRQRYDLHQFVLVPDLGTCCFGGSPKLTHMIEVTLTGGKTVDYSMTKRKLGGILKVDRRLKPTPGRPGVYYQLIADYAR